jgi:hypothetical protein
MAGLGVVLPNRERRDISTASMHAMAAVVNTKTDEPTRIVVGVVGPSVCRPLV